MNITFITLEHTNPSLGPHETVTEVTLTKSKDNVERITSFIRTAQVNGVVTLEAYIKAVQSKDMKVLEEVSKNAPDRMLTTGGTISNLHIHFEEEASIRLNDVYRRFNLTHFYPDFTSYMVAQGTKTQYKPFLGFGGEEKDVPPKMFDSLVSEKPPKPQKPTKD
ncbi:MAG TPA: hypothetical protein DCS93_00615 [Microscillaceae bacterium]|nr:hypothetical protein [Microscillaceae bacterium]